MWYLENDVAKPEGGYGSRLGLSHKGDEGCAATECTLAQFKGRTRSLSKQGTAPSLGMKLVYF